MFPSLVQIIMNFGQKRYPIATSIQRVDDVTTLAAAQNQLSQRNWTNIIILDINFLIRRMALKLYGKPYLVGEVAFLSYI